VQAIVYNDIGKEWVQRFLKRHSELASVRPRSIDAVRVKDTCPERLQRWFDDLETVLAEFNIKLENIYNMDESRFAIGEKEARRCIINAHIRKQFQAKPGRQEWVSVVECNCANGGVVPPLVILKRKNCQHNGFQPVLMVVGGLTVTQRGGQAINTVWSGLSNVLTPEHATKQMGNIECLFATASINRQFSGSGLCLIPNLVSSGGFWPQLEINCVHNVYNTQTW
jgi:hypothetical protein